MKKVLILAMLFIFCNSFINTEKTLEDKLLGVWVKKRVRNNGIWVYVKKEPKDKDEYYNFLDDDTLEDKTKWIHCGGSIITYSKVTSEWQVSKDSILKIKYNKNSSKSINYLFSKNFKIIKVSNDKLVIKLLNKNAFKLEN